jgi:hypothetical protein
MALCATGALPAAADAPKPANSATAFDRLLYRTALSHAAPDDLAAEADARLAVLRELEKENSAACAEFGEDGFFADNRVVQFGPEAQQAVSHFVTVDAKARSTALRARTYRPLSDAEIQHIGTNFVGPGDADWLNHIEDKSHLATLDPATRCKSAVALFSAATRDGSMTSARFMVWILGIWSKR